MRGTNLCARSGAPVEGAGRGLRTPGWPAMGRKRSDVIDGQHLNNHVLLGVLARVVPADVVDDVLRRTGRQNWRARHLLPRLVVYYPYCSTKPIEVVEY